MASSGSDDDGQLIDDLYTNPWIDASKVPGGAPLFDRLDDEAGRRYVVGAGEWLDAEGGTPQRFPSVLAMERVLPPDAEPNLPDAPDPGAFVPYPTIGNELQTAIENLSADSDATLPITIVMHSEELGIQVSIDRAMANGTIHTRTDYEQELDVLLDERRERILIALSPLAWEVETLGGVVTWQAENATILKAELPVEAIETLASRSDVRLIDISGKEANSLTNSDGLVHQQAAQLRQFVQGGWTGDGIIVAIVELNVEDGVNFRSFNTTHGAWRESNPASDFRFVDFPGATGLWNCTVVPCVSTPAFLEQPGNHATNIAGIIFGDFTEGQLASVPVGEREPSSGFARESRAHFYLTKNDEFGVEAAFDSILGLGAGVRPHIVNNSFQVKWLPKCEGASTTSALANDLYLDGIAMIVGAGNQEGSATKCETVSPADAIGAFTVGAHLNSPGTTLGHRTGVIYDPIDNEGSSWGGNALEGDNRSIVDITAAGPRAGLVKPDGTHTLSSSTGKTSYATAVVSATAADLMHHRFAAGGSWIDTPGFLYALLLAMGDRQGVNGKTTKVPDHRWGVGRLRARLLGTGGMGAPWFWYSGVTCIGQGETWDFNPVGTSLPSSIEAVKVAAYWYDHRHENNSGTQVANVNLSLRTSSAGGAANEVVGDTDPHDNKAWAFAADWPASPAIIRLHGAGGITGHNDPICGTNQIRVYFAFFAEDSDRIGVPTYNPATGEGIYPEHL